MMGDAEKWVYEFTEGSRDMRDLLGGKGANVAEMTRVLGAERVPAGFTITTEACVAYMNAEQAFPDGLDDAGRDALARAGGARGQDARRPGRPAAGRRCARGARESMPGMMDTVLNLGMNDESVAGLAEKTGNERFAWDSYRRFVQMYGNVVVGIAGEKFEDAIKAIKKDRGVKDDTELDVDALRELTATFKGFYDFPSDPQDQLAGAIRAVFDSWMGDRAVEYRRINRIPDDWGTAVNVQQMVFGNKGDTSRLAASRSRATRSPARPSRPATSCPTRRARTSCRGVRTPRDIRELRDWQPEVHEQLFSILRTAGAALRRHAGHRVHGGRGQAVHVADAQRQAPGAGGGALRGRRGGRGAAGQGAAR